MGTMVPGKQYIYEKADGVTYRRELGGTDRVIVGWDESSLAVQDDRLWAEIRKAAVNNPGLQELLDTTREFYELSKDSK
tara:strand:- start:1506 stop:1742 length:237 start_codon:yes stop_codon:yes gene_type:complete